MYPCQRKTRAVAGTRTACRGAGRSDRTARRCRPELIPVAEERTFTRIPAGDRSLASPHQHLRRRIPHPPPHGHGHSHVLPSERLLLLPYAYYHGLRRRGRRANVSGYDTRPEAGKKGRRRVCQLRRRFLRQAGELNGFRTVGR